MFKMWNRTYMYVYVLWRIGHSQFRFSWAETFVTTADIFQFSRRAHTVLPGLFCRLMSASHYYTALHDETPTTKIMWKHSNYTVPATGCTGTFFAWVIIFNASVAASARLLQYMQKLVECAHWGRSVYLKFVKWFSTLSNTNIWHMHIYLLAKKNNNNIVVAHWMATASPIKWTNTHTALEHGFA